MPPFPDYPRDEEDFIPDALCQDCLRVWAEYDHSYLWGKITTGMLSTGGKSRQRLGVLQSSGAFRRPGWLESARTPRRFARFGLETEIDDH